MARESFGFGRLVFGLAFITIGVTWLLAEAGLVGDAGAAWLTVVTALSLGTAGLATVLSRLLRATP